MDKIDLNDARVYFAKAVVQEKPDMLIKLFSELEDDVLYDLLKLCKDIDREVFSLLVDQFNYTENYELSERILIAESQIKLIQHGTSTKNA